jgi:hypothetical protein
LTVYTGCMPGAVEVVAVEEEGPAAAAGLVAAAAALGALAAAGLGAARGLGACRGANGNMNTQVTCLSWILWYCRCVWMPLCVLT